MKLYLVGGSVRDHLLGAPVSTKDLDFAVEASSLDEMRVSLRLRGTYREYQVRPEFVCVRGSIRRDVIGDFSGIIPPSTEKPRRIDADFTLCRAERMYTDKRHPSVVTPADILTDLSRRDFTMNAVAIGEEGEWLDPYNGAHDARAKLLRTVGSAGQRFEEDPLRMLRAVRFAVKYGLQFHYDLDNAVNNPSITALIKTLPHERVREELNKAFAHDYRATIMLLFIDYPCLGDALQYHPDLWLKATTEAR